MLFKPKLKTEKKRHNAFIYAVVFNSTFSVLLVFTLFFSFALQPIHQAYANEAMVEPEVVEEPLVAEDVEEQVEVETTVTEEIPFDLTEEILNDVDTPQDISEDLEEINNVISSTTEEATDEGDADLQQEETVEEKLIENTEDTSNDSDTEAEVSEEETDSENSTTTEVTTVNTVEAQSLITEGNFYQFSKSSCVAVGEGNFHCTDDTASEINSQAVVFAEVGPNLNTEIYLRTAKGTLMQLTDNAYDDMSPNYDAETKQIVWQRLIDDRYQIILYDINDESESQLTFSRTNNMEPRVSKSGIVWQAWDGSDWEIMYFDGKYTDQITSNDSQDVAPAINEGHILWSVLGEDQQEARVYSLDSGEILTIKGYEGGLISNPRFVLVYDTKFENGDIVTQGFDPITGLSAPIASKPAPEPIELPEADSTGEIRALIQNKSSQKDDQIIEISDGNATSSDGNPNYVSSSTATLNLKATTTSDSIASSSSLVAEPEFLELTDYDLILTPKTPVIDENTASSSD